LKLTPEALKINVETVSQRLQKLLKSLVETSGASGVVVGLSGGVDSSTVAALAAEALGGSRVYGVTMPEEGLTSRVDVEDAEKLAEKFGLNFYKAEISQVVEAFERVIPVFAREETVAWGNLKPRIRMTILYYFANRFNLLVAGTGNRSELLVGYFTKYGDGAADFLPIGGLYKTQVFQLAAHLGVPSRILEKTPTAGLWPGQTDEGELGVKYATLDLILHGLVDLRLPKGEVASQLGVPVSLVEKVEGMVEASAHKRLPAPVLQPF